MESANDGLATGAGDISLDIPLLESSFRAIAPRADEFVDAFYARLFELYPQTRDFFAATDMALQRKKLIAALVLVMENLRAPETLRPALLGLGQKHQSHNIDAAHYPMVGDALLKTFSAFLGPAWTPALENAWVDAFAMITQTMLSGYAAPDAP
jgi:hemoglobin-like flavoprotein